ncbi:response regulator, partial [Paenibacillus sp. N3.4]|uniref:response regulator n=1 Tax=Paenibacillus sp. N3.4 TaxID=2603222 RepID=UPI0011CB94BB
ILSGSIGVTSELGEGSSFTCWLPLCPAESPPIIDKIAANLDDQTEESSEVSILLIDDEPSNQQLMRRYLAKKGWSLAFAENGQEGLRLAKKFHPKVICLDILMPSMDGWRVLSALKSDPELNNIPVIIVSMTDEKKLGFSLGATEILSKPVERNQLIKVIDKYIGHQSSHSILVIEDDVTTNEMMAKLLRNEGFTVTQALNGRDAIACVAKEVPELILLDLMMPEMDGFEFVSELRKQEAWSTIPVVVLTAKLISLDERMKLNGYVNDIVQKGSFDRKSLLADIRRFMVE